MEWKIQKRKLSITFVFDRYKTVQDLSDELRDAHYKMCNSNKDESDCKTPRSIDFQNGLINYLNFLNESEYYPDSVKYREMKNKVR